MQINKEKLDNEVFKAGIIDPENAVKIGLIDGIRNIDQ